VKIHRSFVIDLGVDPNAEAIVSAVLGMARDAGLNVTAAGVETEQQLAMLRNMRCNHLQGFLLGRPAPASKIVNRAPSYLAPA
jgi:EAL domain-containing protein (putative c-di-GMP-specific phosphodiesterase class I)